MKLQLMLIYNHNLLNYTLKCRFFKFRHRVFSFLKEVNQHIYLVKSFVLIIETCKLFQFCLQFIDLCRKLSSLLNVFSLVKKAFSFQSCKDVSLLSKLGDFFVNVHYLCFTVELFKFQILQ